MSELYLIRLPLDLNRLAQWAAERRLGWTHGGGFDEGRALHHLLTESFGKGRLQPFRLVVPPRGTTRAHLYAYSPLAAETLKQEARAVALPEHLGVIELAALEDKPMPTAWQVGRRLGFELRLRPVRRLLKPLALPGGRPFGVGDEVDAFLVEALRHFPGVPPEDSPLSREAVYRDWLGERLAGSATLLTETVRLASFQRHRAERRGAVLEGPDALLRGDLEIKEPQAFQAALAQGVGRHRAYGFGMLLLRPASGG